MRKPLAGLFAVFALTLTIGAPLAESKLKPKVMPHEVAGHEQCDMCHNGKLPDIKAVPATHTGRDATTCVLCHTKDSPLQTADPKPTPHDLEGRSACSMCHSGAMEGMPAKPANHKDFEDKSCLLCHAAAK